MLAFPDPPTLLLLVGTNFKGNLLRGMGLFPDPLAPLKKTQEASRLASYHFCVST